MPQTRPIPPSIQIVRVIADLDGVKPEEIDIPLGDVLDPDALDTILAGHEGEISIEFTYADHHVIVTQDRIYVDGRASALLE